MLWGARSLGTVSCLALFWREADVGVSGCSGRDARLPGTGLLLGNMLWLLLNHPLELVVQSSDRLWPDACNLNVAQRAGEVSSGHRPLGALDLVFVFILLCTFKVYFKLFS